MKTLLAAILGAAAFAATAQAGTHGTPTQSSVKFSFDSSLLPLDVATDLTSIVSYASAHPNVRVVLDAHCDPSGTQAYNVGLAIRRAEAVRTALTEAGVDNSQIVLAIYGEGGARAASFSDDRRVDVSVTNDAVAEVIDRTLQGHGTAVRWERPMTQAEIDVPVTDTNVASR